MDLNLLVSRKKRKASGPRESVPREEREESDGVENKENFDGPTLFEMSITSRFFWCKKKAKKKSKNDTKTRTLSTPMNEPLLGGNGGGSGSQTPTGTSQGQFSPGTLTRTSSWAGGGAPSGDDAGASAPAAGGFNSGTGGAGPGYYTRLESLARRKPGQPVRESARAR